MIASNAAAQVNNKWVGGTFSFAAANSGQNQVSTTIMPEFGVNTGGKWAFGGQVGFTTNKSLLGGDVRRSSTYYLLPFAVLTFAEVCRFNIFVQGELPIAFYGGRDYDGTSMQRSNSIGFAIRPGINYSFSERFGFIMFMPSLLRFENRSNAGSSFSAGINDGYSLQEYLLNSSIGFIYMF